MRGPIPMGWWDDLFGGLGHRSKQSVTATTKVAVDVVQTTAQNCIDVAYGGNTIAINGDYNVLSGVDQTVSISVNSDCSTFAAQNSTFSSDLSDSLSQVLKDQELALTEWMDSSHDDQSSHIREQITANYTQSVVQSCVNNLDGYNLISVTGSGNVVRDVTQAATFDVISQCLLQNGQTSDVISNVTNTVNQHGTYQSTNPFAFIADALEAAFKDYLVAAAVVFIVVVAFIFLYLLARKKAPAAAPVILAGPAFAGR